MNREDVAPSPTQSLSWAVFGQEICLCNGCFNDSVREVTRWPRRERPSVADVVFGMVLKEMTFRGEFPYERGSPL